jgi:hypothetical protein
MNILPKKYCLKDGSIYWHKLYFAVVPTILTRYSPPFGSYNYAYYLIRPDKYVMDLIDEVRYFIQRGRRGYSDRDVWGWYSHHSRMMVGVIQYLRKHKHGYPLGLTPAKWSKALAIMEKGFQSVIDEENDYHSYKNLSKAEYRKLIFIRQRTLMLGLKYFRKYYYNLWD